MDMQKIDFVEEIWRDKYAYNGEKTPEDMFKRLSEALSKEESKYRNPLSFEEIFELLNNFKYIILGGSPISGIGTDKKVSLSNCFFVDAKYDSYGGIFEVDQFIAQVSKRRGGVGTDLSNFRPKGLPVHNAAKKSTGIVPWMERYSNTIREVAQEGRRGALMLSIDIRHPDSPDFITAKLDKTKITGANISVKVPDDFMKAVQDDEMYTLRYPINSDKPIITKEIRARDLWDKLVKTARNSSEPGILFIDTIHDGGPQESYPNHKTIGTNPCGELPLADKASCILLSLNLFEVVENPFTKDAKIDYGKLYDIAYKAQKLADDIVSLELEKIDEIIEKIKYDPEPSEIRDNEYRLWLGIKNKLYRSRRTGLGYMGAADMLAALGVPYGSDKSVDILDNVTSMIAKASYESSIDMAEDRGCFFDWMRDIDLQSNYFTRLLYQRLSRKHIKKYEVYGRRNLSNLTIAPTGTTSMMAQVSSGLEPVFMLHYKRRRKVNEDYKGDVITDSVGDRWIEFDVVHPKFKMWAEITHGIDNFYEYWGNITNEQKFALIKESPYNGSLAHEINPAQKVRIQSAVQKWIDHSISITYNLKNDVTEKEVSNLFFLAWKLKLKGITIYRDGSRDGVLISVNNKEKNEFVPHDAPKRPEVLDADIFYPTIRGEKYVVMVGLLNNNPYELFCFKINGYKVPGNPTIGKIQKVRKSKRVKKYNLLSINDEVIVEDIVSKFEKPEYEFATRMISTALRHGASISFIVEQLDKTDGFITDYNKVISRVLKKYVAPKITDIKCPKCGSNMIMKEGCVTCPSCGYSKC